MIIFLDYKVDGNEVALSKALMDLHHDFFNTIHNQYSDIEVIREKNDPNYSLEHHSFRSSLALLINNGDCGISPSKLVGQFLWQINLHRENSVRITKVYRWLESSGVRFNIDDANEFVDFLAVRCECEFDIYENTILKVAYCDGDEERKDDEAFGKSMLKSRKNNGCSSRG